MKQRRQALGQRRYAVTQLRDQCSAAPEEHLTDKLRRQGRQERDNVIELLDPIWPEKAVEVRQQFDAAQTRQELNRALSSADEALRDALELEEKWQPADYRLRSEALRLLKAAQHLSLAPSRSQLIDQTVEAVLEAQNEGRPVTPSTLSRVGELRADSALYGVSQELQDLHDAIQVFNAACADLLRHMAA